MDTTEKNGTAVENLLLQIRQGDDHFLKKLYEANRPRFVQWFQSNHQISNDEAIDLYQKAFTIFYFNVKDNKITTLNSTIATYLFGIGKNLVKEMFRKQKSNVELDAVPEMELARDDIFHTEEDAHQKSIVKNILEKLEEPCKSILLMYYFKNFSMESIAANLGYKNEGVAKKKKCLCLKKIREELIEAKTEL